LIVELFLIRNILFYGLKTAVLLTRSYGKWYARFLRLVFIL
jgi:hypothetical protein